MSFFGIVTSCLVVVFGILMPARHTYKALYEQELLSWAKYWIVYACLISLEVLGDTFLAWIPLFVEAKLIFVLWLVVSAPQGSVWLFDVILNPLLAQHMAKIDHFLQHGKQHLLGDALNFTSEFCTRSLDTVLPVVSQLFKKPDKEKPTAEAATILLQKSQEHAALVLPLGTESETEKFDQQDDTLYLEADMEMSYEVSFPSSQSQELLVDQPQQSLPDLAKKLTNRPRQREYSNDALLDVMKKDFKEELKTLLQKQRPSIPRKERHRNQ